MLDAAATRAHAPRRTGRWLVAAGLVAFIALLAYGLTTTAPNDSVDRRLAAGKAAPAPGFSLEVLRAQGLPSPLAARLRPALADGRLSLDELRGTPVVLNMWASWCTPCRQEAGRLERGWRTYGHRGVLFLGLDIQDLRGDALAFLSELGITYPSVREPERDVASSYGATGIPETYFIDARSRVVGHVIGVVSDEQLRAGANAARTDTVVGRASGGRSFKLR